MKLTRKAHPCCQAATVSFISIHNAVLLCSTLAYRAFCPSSGHRDRQMTVLGFPQTLLDVCVFENEHLCSSSFVLRSNLRFLLPWFYLSPAVSTLSHRVAVSLFSLSYLRTPDHPRPTSHRKSMLAAAESALMFRQPSPATLLFLLPNLPYPLAFLERHIKWHSVQLWHHNTLSLHFMCPVNLIGHWAGQTRGGDRITVSTSMDFKVKCERNGKWKR